MNEITRIHIAKVPYDIEIVAKKQLEKYIQALAAYADDDELLQDIEIRITELLAERSVLINGIIAADDVSAIRGQLGEPKDFMGEGDIAVGHDLELSGDSTRKLFRNTDSAVLGGVLSGIASFFRVNPLWVRILFIILLFASAGTVILLYGILWIAIPPARTAAEKLQMNGRSVTLTSIRELNEDEPRLVAGYERASTARHMIMLAAGVSALAASIGALLVTIFAAFSIVQFDVWADIQTQVQWAYISAYILAIVSGVLLSALFAAGAYAAFARKASKRLITGAAAIIAMGLITFGAAVGLVSYQSWASNDQMQRNITESYVELPANFSAITMLTVDAPSVNIEYIVDTKTRIVLRSLPGIGEPVVSLDGTKATISFDSLAEGDFWPHMQPTLKIYGPKLDNLVVKQGQVGYYANSQDMSLETIGNGSWITLQRGTFGKLTIKASDQSSVDAANVTVLVADIVTQTGSSIELGTVKSLSVTQPEACPIGKTTRVSVQSVSAGIIQYNGAALNAETQATYCGSIQVGADE
ncbi:PspC domain-containing protein [Pedobacter sp.]|nr:PspC domain-containing protein [Candidatus Saccharibacteria bacterium]